MEIDPKKFRPNALRAILYHQVFSPQPRDICIEGGNYFHYISSAVVKNALEYDGNQLDNWITSIAEIMQSPKIKVVTFYSNESEVNI